MGGLFGSISKKKCTHCREQQLFLNYFIEISSLDFCFLFIKLCLKSR
jgi:hypothetical protein